jgi:hypothetical protein
MPEGHAPDTTAGRGPVVHESLCLARYEGIDMNQGKRIVLTSACAVLLFGTPGRAGATTTLEVGGGGVVDFNMGDDVLKLTFTDGSTQNISAGNGVGLSLGAGVIFFDGQTHELEVTLTAGFKYSTMSPAQNASLDWVRVPLELLAFYRNDTLHFRVGGGATMYGLNSLSGGGDLSGLDVHFAPSPGAILQADFIWGGLFAGLRFTIMSFHSTTSNENISANALGVDLGFFHHFGQ